MGYRSFAEIERDNQELYEDGLAKESERLSKLVNKEIEVIKREGDGYGESEDVTFNYRNHEYSVEFIYGMPAGYNDRKFIELIKEIDKELEEELKEMYSPKQALNNIKYHYFNGEREHNDIEVERFWFERTGQALKALEIIKETPEFAWYVKIYDNAYEMISDVKGFRVNNSVEELQEMFDLLKKVLGL